MAFRIPTHIDGNFCPVAFNAACTDKLFSCRPVCPNPRVVIRRYARRTGLHLCCVALVEAFGCPPKVREVVQHDDRESVPERLPLPVTHGGQPVTDTSIQHLPSATFEIDKQATLMTLAVVLADKLGGVKADHLRCVDRGKSALNAAGRTPHMVDFLTVYTKSM